jgi:hypothetical protein
MYLDAGTQRTKTFSKRRELLFEPVPEAWNGGGSRATKASAREEQNPDHKTIPAAMAVEAITNKTRAEAHMEEKDEEARRKEEEDENEEETHRTTTAKSMATTAEDNEIIHNYWSELNDRGEAVEDHTEWGERISNEKMPARRSQANQSEKVREAQEKTKKLMADNDLQDAFTGGTTIHSHCSAHARTQSGSRRRANRGCQRSQPGWSPVRGPRLGAGTMYRRSRRVSRREHSRPPIHQRSPAPGPDKSPNPSPIPSPW